MSDNERIDRLERILGRLLESLYLGERVNDGELLEFMDELSSANEN